MHHLDEYLYGDPPNIPDAMEVECQGCRSTFIIFRLRAVEECPLCGSTQMVGPRPASPFIAPDEMLLPSAICSRTEAEAKIRAWLSNRRFVRSDLKGVERFYVTDCVYVSVWNFIVETDSSYVYRWGRREEIGWVTESHMEGGYWVEGAQVGGHLVTSRHYSKELGPFRWGSPESGQIHLHKDVSVEAFRFVCWPERELPRTHLPSVIRFAPEALRPFDATQLAEATLNRYEVGLSEGQEMLKKQIKPDIERAILAPTWGKETHCAEEIRIESIATEYSNWMFRQIIIPVWLGSYAYRGKTYRFGVNAQNGAVSGDEPEPMWFKMWHKMMGDSPGCSIVAGLILLFLFMMVWQFLKSTGIPLFK
jgi:hypothetical protein